MFVKFRLTERKHFRLTLVAEIRQLLHC